MESQLLCLMQVATIMAQENIGFKKFELIKTEPLGNGSYGAVYKAVCDDLPCAGKILHSTLFQSNDPGSMTIMRRFHQECSFLSAIRHPNIVQYLDSYQDPETRLPVLLMELMDDSLTKFLEQSQEPLSFHIQVNICHDIALALAFLHSNAILHRDLSSNNVLLIGAGNRAKVTDFGMAKLLDDLTPQTMCPGTLVYMPPEALDEAPVYTKKLDTFSFGVLGIQIMTRKFPDPGPRMVAMKNPRSLTRNSMMLVSETERRKSHIDLIVPTHPLLKIAKKCLNFEGKDRPSAEEHCHCLSTLKKDDHYRQSVQQVHVRNIPAQIEEKERQLEAVDLQLTGKKKINKKRLQELQEEKQQLQQDLREEEKRLRQEAMRLKCERELEVQQLTDSNEQLHRRCRQLQQELEQLKQKIKLCWKTCNAAPYKMYKGSATVRGNMAYFSSAPKKHVHSYNSDTEEWSTLPECPRYYFTLTVVNGCVTAVGGSEFIWGVREKLTNSLLSAIEVEGNWVEILPSMPTKRKLTAVVCSGKTLVVAGGVGEENTILSTVEVMDTDTWQWSTASSLPHPLSDATATVCGDRVYLLGLCEQPAAYLTLSLMLQPQSVGTESTY